MTTNEFIETVTKFLLGIGYTPKEVEEILHGQEHNK